VATDLGGGVSSARRFSNDGYAAPSVANDAFGDAAEEKAIEPATAVGAEDNHVRWPRRRHLEDLPTRIALSDDRRRGETSGPQPGARTLHQFSARLAKVVTHVHYRCGGAWPLGERQFMRKIVRPFHDVHDANDGVFGTISRADRVNGGSRARRMIQGEEQIHDVFRAMREQRRCPTARRHRDGRRDNSGGFSAKVRNITQHAMLVVRELSGNRNCSIVGTSHPSDPSNQERIMFLVPQHVAPVAAIMASSDESHLVTRIRAEFREMPGLRLTLPQASRLFSIPSGRCAQILDLLVRSGHLATDGKAFACARSGRRCA
jgi:hypothetical protein